MSPHGLALRTLMLGGPRSVLAIVLIAASLSVLDLYAGHIASARARMEYQAVIGERLGHLAILRADDPLTSGKTRMFEAAEALRVLRLVQSSPGVALAVPQMSVSGIAASGARSALFFGEGIAPAPERAGTVRHLPGTLQPAIGNGIAVSSKQASSLGLVQGSKLTLTGATLAARAVPLDAQVVDVYSNSGRAEAGRSPLLMPFAMAQTLLDTELTERIVVYLSEGARTDERRTALTGALRSAGIPVHVQAWHEQSSSFANERSAADIAFDSVAGMVFAVIAATIAAAMSMNVLDRRREVATLRALGMRSSAVFVMFVLEALAMALTGVAASMVASGLIAWIVNRAALSYSAHNALSTAPMLVELDFYRMAMAVVTVLAVALLAALVPAFKAARGAIAPGLAA
jgi:putative ABC transport system permease protein